MSLKPTFSPSLPAIEYALKKSISGGLLSLRNGSMMPLLSTGFLLIAVWLICERVRGKMRTEHVRVKRLLTSTRATKRGKEVSMIAKRRA